MMDLQTLKAMSKDAGRAAKKAGVQPFVFKAGDITPENFARIPNLGNAVPKGWKRLSLKSEYDEDNYKGIYMGDADGAGAYFVDNTGEAVEGEPALTVKAFLKQVKPGLGYGIVEVGIYQIKIGVFAVRTA
jgi:hypothetical protein